MNRSAIGLICLGAFCSLLSSQTATLRQPSDAEITNAIAKVKNLPASKLDKHLSETRLKDWLRTQVGADAKINWAYQSAGEPWGHLYCVQAVGGFTKDQSFFVSVNVSKHPSHPSFESGWGMVGRGQNMWLKRLSDLPRALNKLHEDNQNGAGPRT